MKRILSIVLLFCILVPCCIADKHGDHVDAQLLPLTGESKFYFIENEINASILAAYMYYENELYEDTIIPNDILYEAITSNKAWVGKLHIDKSNDDMLCMFILIGDNGMVPIFINEEFNHWGWWVSESEKYANSEEEIKSMLDGFLEEWYAVNPDYVEGVLGHYFNKTAQEMIDTGFEPVNPLALYRSDITVHADFLNSVLPEHSIQECMQNELHASKLAGYMYFELGSASATHNNLPIDKESYSDAIERGDVIIGYANNKICILVFVEGTVSPIIIYPIFIDVVDNSWVWSINEYGIMCNNGHDCVYWINNLLSTYYGVTFI